MEIDAQSFDPAARMVVLAIAFSWDDALQRALQRARAIAPLHPLVLGARALQVKPSRQARALVSLALEPLAAGRGPKETFLVVALAATRHGLAVEARKLRRAADQQSDQGPDRAADQLRQRVDQALAASN